MTKDLKIHMSGVREHNPTPKRFHHALPITERVAPGIRIIVARIMPLESYTDVDPLKSYAELLLLLRLQPDENTLVEIMREARNRLTDVEYDKLIGYKDLLVNTRLLISPEVQP